MKLIALIFLFYSYSSFAQRDIDTVRVLMLVCDTLHNRPFNNPIPNSISYNQPPVYWMFGYSVREKHNTAEGVADSGGSMCVDNGMIVPCYHDYWMHIKYLDIKKNKLPNNIIVWDSKTTN